MAYACALIAFVGFAATYWLPVATGRFAGPPIVHLHGLLFSAWTLFFIAQTTLAATGSIERHRSLGLFGVALATAMLFAGVMAQVHSIKIGITAGLEVENRTFSIVPITIILFFACAVAAAIANIARPEVHKRLMLVATISLLTPAIARLVALAASVPIAPGHPPPIVFSLVPSFASDLLVIAAITYDWRMRGRPHSVYLIAGAVLLTLQIARVPLGSTPAWHAVTDWLLAFST
jgi:hypothetical protein